MNEVIECGVVVIGAGAIGLAIAAELSKTHKSVIVLEAEPGLGYHTSSRNSEVIHSGIYYTPGSLKSELCLRGKWMLYQYLERNQIPHNRCGKLIVAQRTPDERRALDALADNARKIELEFKEIKWNSTELSDIPLKPCDAILIPDTGYFDSHEFMRALEHDLLANDGIVSYRSRVSSIEREGQTWIIQVNENAFRLKTDCIVNSAGLYADKIASMAGFNKYKLYFYKGEYYKTNKIKNLKHLVYAVPPADQMSLGIHTRNYMDGTIGFGPNAYQVKDVMYGIDDSHRQEFLSDISKYLNVNLTADEIYPDYAGIRPKINGGGFKADFIIEQESCDGNRQMISLIGIESPGLTCSLSIAEYVCQMVGG